MKKIIAGILTLMMAAQFAFTVSAQNNYALIDYSTGTEVLENATLKSGSSSDFVTKEEGYALRIYTSSTLGANYRSFSLSTDFLDSFNEDNIKVTIRYYDDGTGNFCFGYKTRAEVSKIEEPIILTNTGTLKEKSFTLYDFGTEFNSFSINLYDAAMSQSKSDVIIKSIKLEKTGKYFPVNIMDNQITVGNQFFTGETPMVSLLVQNKSNARIPVSYNVVVTDSYGNEKISTSGTTNFSKGYSTKKINLATADIAYGVYDAVIKFAGTSNADIYGEYKTNFSMSVEAEQSDDFCVNTHTSTYTDRDPSKSVLLVKKMGCNMVREGLWWGTVEQSKGNYSIPQSFYNTYNYARQNNVDMLVTLNGNNELYIDSEYQNYPYATGKYYFPQGDAAVKAFGDFVEYVVGELRGKVKYFMIWNEFEGTCFNRPTEMYRYTALLEEAYKRAKQANPDCVIVGGSGFEPGLSWTEEYFNFGGANISDAIAFHLYHNWVGKADYHANNVKNIFNLMKENYSWQTFPLWVTESGFSTAIGLNTEDEQYSNAIRLYIMAKEQGVERFFYYDFKNDRPDKREIQGNFGCINSHVDKHKVPYSAKPAYVAFANMNNLLAKAEIVKSEITDDGTKVYKFLRPDGKNVWVMWTDSKTKTTAAVSTGKQTLENVDQFGNRTTVSGSGGVFNVTVSEIPTYLVEK